VSVLSSGDSEYELLVAPAKGKASQLPVPAQGEIEIGKDEACDLVLDDDQVSRRHAMVRAQGGFFVLEDLSSKTVLTRLVQDF